MFRLVAILSLTVLLSACGNAKWTSIFRNFSADDDGRGQGILIDAKQRAILSVKTRKASGAIDREGVCAEPSPDAISAISTALSASGGGVFGGGGQASAALGTALKESASQLGTRNVTVQVLRDAYYRLCEAYLNGSLSKSGYASFQNKYISAMVVAHAIEQLAPVPAQSARTGDDKEGVSAETKAEVTVNVTGADAPPSDESEETEGDRQASSESTVTAGSPAVQVNLPSDRQEPLPQHVSMAVAFIVHQFMQRTALDDCVQYLTDGPFPLALPESEPDAYKKALEAYDGFATACQNFVTAFGSSSFNKTQIFTTSDPAATDRSVIRQ